MSKMIRGSLIVVAFALLLGIGQSFAVSGYKEMVVAPFVFIKESSCPGMPTITDTPTNFKPPVASRIDSTKIRTAYDRLANFFDFESYGKFRLNMTYLDYRHVQWSKDPYPGTGYKGVLTDPPMGVGDEVIDGGHQPIGVTAPTSPLYVGSGYSVDAAFSDGVWTPGERFHDLNGDGRWTQMEPWWDAVEVDAQNNILPTHFASGNGLLEKHYTTYGEEFADWNSDGKYTAATNIVVYDRFADNDTNVADNKPNDGVIGNPVSASMNGILFAVKTLLVNELDLNYDNHFSNYGSAGNTSINNTQSFLTGDRVWNYYPANASGTTSYVSQGGAGWVNPTGSVTTGGIGEFTPCRTSAGAAVYSNAGIVKVIEKSGVYYSYETIESFPPITISGNVYTISSPVMVVSKQVNLYRSPEPFTDTNNNGVWESREPFEDYLIRYDYTPLTTDNPPKYIQVTANYIRYNYAGDTTALINRIGNGQYDGPESFKDKMQNCKMEIYDRSKTETVRMSNWDSNLAGNGTTPASFTQWWANTFGTVAPTLDSNLWKGRILDETNYVKKSKTGILSVATPVDGGQNIATWGAVDETTWSQRSVAVDAAHPVYPDMTGALFDSDREFRDMPSSLYHSGGDEKFSEETDPRSYSIIGGDYGDNKATGILPDRKYESSGPWCFNIHGESGLDAGNQFNIELLTWDNSEAASGSSNVSGDLGRAGKVVGTRLLGDTAEKKCRDTNLDGFIDQGRCPDPRYSNYIVDTDISTIDNGRDTNYPYNAIRLFEDMVEMQDESVDFTGFSRTVTGNTISYMVDYFVYLYPDTGVGSGFLHASGLGGSFQTKDNYGYINWMGQPWDISNSTAPGGNEGGGGMAEGGVGHEFSHDYLNEPDFYDYDVWNGLFVNYPIGAEDLMGTGVLKATSLYKGFAGWTAPRDLKKILMPGQEQLLEFYPVEVYEGQYYYFAKSGASAGAELFHLYYEMGMTEFTTWPGLCVIHIDSGDNSDGITRQQRLGDHYTYQWVEADGYKERTTGVDYFSGNVEVGDRGDRFGALSDEGTIKKVWNYNSYPTATWWNGVDCGLEILDIVSPTPGNPNEPMKILFRWKNQEVSEFSWLSFSGIKSAAGSMSLKFDTYDKYGATKIYLFRDNDNSGYDGQLIGNLDKGPGLRSGLGYNTGVSSLPDGGYYYYGLLAPGTDTKGRTEDSYFIYTHFDKTNQEETGLLTVSHITTTDTVVHTNNSTLQTWTLECVIPGGDGAAKFSVTGSVTGKESNLLTSGNTYNLVTANSCTGGANFSIRTGTYDGVVVDWQKGDTYWVRTTGLTPYSEAVMVKKGVVIMSGPEAPGLVVIGGNTMTSEGGGTRTLSARLNSLPTSDVVVTITSTNIAEGMLLSSISADAVKVSSLKLYYTPANYQVEQLFMVKGIDDDLLDGDRQYYLQFSVSSADAKYSNLVVSDARMVNQDDELFGIAVSKSAITTNEDGTSANFNVVLNSAPLFSVYVYTSATGAVGKLFPHVGYDTTEGAVNPSILVFSKDNWNSPQPVFVTGVDDSLVDGDIAYSLIMVSTSQDNNYYGRKAEVKVTNVDNDVASVVVSTISGNTSESGTSAYFTVTLSSQPSGTVTVKLTSNNTAEGKVTPSVLTFISTNFNVPQTVTVTGQDDNKVDGSQQFNVNFVVTAKNDPNYNNILVPPVLVSNDDDDNTGFSLTPVSNHTNEDGATATFRVRCNTKPGGTLIVDVASDDLTEGIIFSGSSLTFNDSNWNGEQTVTVKGLADTLKDGAIPYTVSLKKTATTTPAYSVISYPKVSLVNEDNSTAKVLVDVLKKYSSELNDRAVFTVALTSQPSAGTVSLTFVTLDSTEGTFQEGNVHTITFNQSNYATPQTVFVNGVSDTLADGHMVYAVKATVSATSDTSYSASVVPNIVLTNLDNQSPWIMVSDPTSDTTSERGATSSFSLVLMSAPSAPVFIPVSSSNPAEGLVSINNSTPSGNLLLRFTDLDYRMPQTITVVGQNETTDVTDGDLPYRILIDPATSGDVGYNGLDAPDVFLRNRDNDQPGVDVSVDATHTNEDGGTINLSIALFSQPSSTVRIDVKISDASEGAISAVNGVTANNLNAVSIIFNSANYRNAQIVTIKGVNDSEKDGDITYSVTFPAVVSDDSNYNALSIPAVTPVNDDNDLPGLKVNVVSNHTSEEGGSATFTVALQTVPSGTVVVQGLVSDVTEGLFAGNTSSIELTFNNTNWSIGQTVTVVGVNDSLLDGAVAYSANLSMDTVRTTDVEYAILAPTEVRLVNDNDDYVGITMNVSSVQTFTTEGAANVVLDVFLNASPANPIIVSVTIDDASEAKVIYPFDGKLAFTEAANIQKVTIQGVDDFVADGDVTYTVTAEIKGADFGGDNNWKGVTKSITLVNTDNDTKGVSFSPATTISITEGGNSAVGFKLNSQPTADVTVAISVPQKAGETLASVSPSSVVVKAATWKANDWHNVSIYGIDDGIVEPSKPYTIDFAMTSTDAAYTLTTSIGLISVDNDYTGLIVSQPSSWFTDEDGYMSSFNIHLASQPMPTRIVALDVASDNASEASVYPTSLVFDITDWQADKTVYVTGKNDGATDGITGYNVRFTANGNCNDDFYRTQLSPVLVPFFNLDNEATSIVLSTPIGTISGNGSVATFTVRLSASVAMAVSLRASVPGLTIVPSVLTFTAENAKSPQIVTVTPKVVAGTAVVITASGSGVSASVSIPTKDIYTPRAVSTQGFILTPVVGQTSEWGRKATFTVSLSTQPNANVTIDFDSNNKTEGTVFPTSLSFTAADWDRKAQVVLTGADDKKIDGNKPWYVVFSTATSDDSRFNGLTLPNVEAINTDDETVGLVYSTQSILTSEKQGPNKTANLGIVLMSAPSANVTVNVSSSSTTEGTVTPSTLAFTRNNWNVPQYVVVTGVDDGVLDLTKDYNIVMTVATTDVNYVGYIPAVVPAKNQSGNLAVTVSAPTNLTQEGFEWIFDQVAQGATRIVQMEVNGGNGKYTWSRVSGPSFGEGTSITDDGTIVVGPVSGRYTFMVSDYAGDTTVTSAQRSDMTFSVYVWGSPTITSFQRLDTFKTRIFIEDLDPTARFYVAYYSIDAGKTWIRVNRNPTTAQTTGKGKATSTAFIDVEFEGYQNAIFKVLATDQSGTVATDSPTAAQTQAATGTVAQYNATAPGASSLTMATSGSGGGGCFLSK